MSRKWVCKDMHLLTVKIFTKQLIMTYLIWIFTVCQGYLLFLKKRTTTHTNTCKDNTIAGLIWLKLRDFRYSVPVSGEVTCMLQLKGSTCRTDVRVMDWPTVWACIEPIGRCSSIVLGSWITIPSIHIPQSVNVPGARIIYCYFNH